MLVGKPRFAEKAAEFLDFIRGSEVVIHNAAFDRGFLDHELGLWDGRSRLADVCTITCSLKLARSRYPGMPNKLDDLLRRLGIRAQREPHGALLDAQLLAQILLQIR